MKETVPMEKVYGFFVFLNIFLSMYYRFYFFFEGVIKLALGVTQPYAHYLSGLLPLPTPFFLQNNTALSTKFLYC